VAQPCTAVPERALMSNRVGRGDEEIRLYACLSSGARTCTRLTAHRSCGRCRRQDQSTRRSSSDMAACFRTGKKGAPSCSKADDPKFDGYFIALGVVASTAFFAASYSRRHRPGKGRRSAPAQGGGRAVSSHGGGWDCAFALSLALRDGGALRPDAVRPPEHARFAGPQLDSADDRTTTAPRSTSTRCSTGFMRNSAWLRGAARRRRRGWG
jgi:hypothetical protein